MELGSFLLRNNSNNLVGTLEKAWSWLRSRAEDVKANARELFLIRGTNQFLRLHNELWDKGRALAEDNVNFSPRFSPKRLRLNAEEYRKIKRPVPPLACATVSALVSAPAELVFEPRMPGEDQRQTPATVPRLFDELFEAPQCLGMQVMPVVD